MIILAYFALAALLFLAVLFAVAAKNETCDAERALEYEQQRRERAVDRAERIEEEWAKAEKRVVEARQREAILHRFVTEQANCADLYSAKLILRAVYDEASL